MVSTAALRDSYPELVTRRPTATLGPRCDFSLAVPVVVAAGGPHYPAGFVLLRGHPAARQIWRAVAAVMAHHRYLFTDPAGGTLSCRRITGGTDTTLHAHGIAGDWNPARNRYRRRVGVIAWGRETDMPPAMIRDIEAIRLVSGVHPVEWGGRWWNVKDPMHFELDVLQTGLVAVNLATLPAGSWGAYLRFERDRLPLDVLMWTKTLDRDGWAALARAEIAAGTEAEVIDYWWNHRAERSDSEHATASRNMTAALAVAQARLMADPGASMSRNQLVGLIESARLNVP